MQALNTRFNVLYNGQLSYDEGLRNINQANTDDYSGIINMYAISKHESANAAKSNMDRTIEKCRKAIKLHSIKKKPERKASKWNDPDYRTWYNQNEFNPALKDAWLLLAKAEFHKADFLGAVGTFSYIARYYSTDNEVVDQCQLWIARAYGEMDWLYEAEQVLSKLKQDKLKGDNTTLYASTNADILLKKNQYKEAIPYLELAIKGEKLKANKVRFQYLLGQLYQKTANTSEAYKAFSNVIKQNPTYEMDFNARINRAGLSKDVNSVRKELRKMIKNPNNKDYCDQLFYVLGNTYLNAGDTLKAIENYKISADTSSRNGFDKAITLATLGNLYYERKNYLKAQPCYDEAAKIFTMDYENYETISRRAETLSELAKHFEVVQLQDSLQKLSKLPLDKQKEIVAALIEKRISDEKAALEAEKRKQLANKPSNFDESFDMSPPIGMAPTTGDWYFYNASIIKSGSTEFRKKWGTRKLEDNWRRSTKAVALFADNQTQTAQTNSNDSSQTVAEKVSDDKSPDFYLQQIPKTPEQIQKSNDEIATSLFNMGMIYKDGLEDYPMALKSFDEFERRFPKDTRTEETLYQSYLIVTKSGNSAAGETFKNQLATQYPNSKYTQVITQPDYLDKLKRMYSEQEQLYADTYEAFNNSKYEKVKENTSLMQKNFPLSTLLPKFEFLNALSVGKSEKTDEFEKLLNDIIEKYPTSDVSSMSKDMLALLKQGNKTKSGGSHNSLLNKRNEQMQTELAETIEEHKFTADKSGKHRLMLVFMNTPNRLNKLLYDIASFNFTRFMVKDFDLVSTRLDSTRTALSITNFESYDEVLWYLGSIQNSPDLSSQIMASDMGRYIISDINYNTMFSYSGLDAYIDFARKNLGATNITQQIAVAQKTTKPTETIEYTAPVAATTIKTEEKKNTTPLATTNSAPAVVSAQPATQQPAIKLNEPAPVSVPLFKNLYAYTPAEPHYVAINILSGSFDYEKFRTGLEQFNKQNYSTLNLKIMNEKYGNQQIIIIGAFPDAGSAKSFLYRIVESDAVYEPIKKTNYRNLMGTQRNLNVMMQKNAMDIYFEFMQQYYLK